MLNSGLKIESSPFTPRCSGLPVDSPFGYDIDNWFLLLKHSLFRSCAGLLFPLPQLPFTSTRSIVRDLLRQISHAVRQKSPSKSKQRPFHPNPFYTEDSAPSLASWKRAHTCYPSYRSWHRFFPCSNSQLNDLKCNKCLEPHGNKKTSVCDRHLFGIDASIPLPHLHWDRLGICLW